jgi:hypothetical protein
LTSTFWFPALKSNDGRLASRLQWFGWTGRETTMMSFDLLLARITMLRTQGVGGERLEAALDAYLREDTLDVLRWLYVEVDAARRSMVRWALAQLDAEVSEMEDLGLAYA